MNGEPSNQELANRLEELSKRVADGFETLGGKLAELRADLDQEKEVGRSRHQEVLQAIDDLSERAFPRAMDREDLEARVGYIEQHLGIDSGK